MAKYRLNVDTDVEHELTDAEVRDLKSFGFKVTEVKGSRSNDSQSQQGSGNEKKEG